MISPAAVLLAAALVAGCAPAVPSPSGTGVVAIGSLSIAVVRSDNLFLGSHQEARLVAADGTVGASAQVPIETPATITAPVGAWTLEAFTVYVSDFGECGPDPAVPSRERCVFPTLEPKVFCRLPVTIRADGPIAVRMTVEDAGCRLETVATSGAAPS